MIDTDKYEERIKSIPIRKLKVGCTLLEDSVFLRDTGLELLAEVKRLREGILNVMAGIYDNMYDMNQALDRVILND